MVPTQKEVFLMSKFGSTEYHVGNLMFFIGVVLILVCIILAGFTYQQALQNSFIVLTFSIIGIIAGIVSIILGSIIIQHDKVKSEKGIIIGEKEKHEISIRSKGNKLFLYVDNTPKLEFETNYLKKESISTTIGKQEKHSIRIEAKASPWSGEVNKYVYIDDNLVLKDERPVW